MATSPGTYKGQKITAGNDASISAQIAAIDRASTPASSGSSSGVGAVNAQGQLVGSGGQVLGMANVADRPGPRAKQPVEEEVAPVPTEEMDPNAPAPKEMVDQVAQAQQQVNQLSQTKGMTLQKTPQGTITALPDESALRKQALQTLNQSGLPASQDAGVGSAVTQAALGKLSPQTESPSIVGSFLDTSVYGSDGIKEILTNFYDVLRPENQKVSLVDEYTKMSKNLGIEQLNAELIDAKKIIEGTEDDIRNEVTAAGGFASDSQVLALANARNKSLIKNYNTLLDTKNAAMEQLQTMMQLSVQDRQFAEAEFDRKLGFAFKVAEFQQRAQDNARSTYMSLGDKMGWDTLLSSVSPYERGVIGKTIGLDTNGLNNLAMRSQQDRVMQMEEAQLKNEVLRSNLSTDKAQRAKIYSDIAKNEYEMNPDNGIDEKTMGKIQASPEYKTINGVLPAMAAVKTYLDAVKESGSFEILNGAKSGRLKSSYGNAIAAWKTLAALGALSGADFGLAENVIPEPSLFTRNSKVKAQLNSAIENGIKQAEIMTTRLGQNYPRATPLLNQQLDDMRVVAYPDQYTYGDDGVVYKIK